MKNHKGDYPKKDKRALASALVAIPVYIIMEEKMITDLEGMVRTNLINSNI